MGLADIIGERPTDKAVLQFILGNLVERTTAEVDALNEGWDAGMKPTQCECWEEVADSINSKIQMSQPAKDAFVAILACAVSLRIPGPMLWMHIVGPSSSMKTTLLDIVGAASDKCFSMSEFTNFYSGSTVGGVDNSLIPRIQQKLFITKDLTPLLKARPEVQDTVFGQARDIYDGHGEKHYNNGKHLAYNGIYFSWVTGVTKAIRDFSRSDLGERFLMAEINSYWSEDGRNIKIQTDTDVEGNAYDNMFATIRLGLDSSTTKMDRFQSERSKCWGLLNYLFEYLADEKTGLQTIAANFEQDREFKVLVDSLAVWLEFARCPKPPKQANLARPEPALPHRSINQLCKLAMCIAVVLRVDHPTAEVKRLIAKYAFDTCLGWALEIMNYIAINPLTSKDYLASTIKISSTYVDDWTSHLIAIGCLDSKAQPNNTGNRGRGSMCYELTPQFRLIADAIGLREKVHHVGAPELHRIFGRANAG